MPIIHEARYFGPGLPEEGTTDPVVAFRAGMAHAKWIALREYLRDKTWTNGAFVSTQELVQHSGEIDDVVRKAQAQFVNENHDLFISAEQAMCKASPPDIQF